MTANLYDAVRAHCGRDEGERLLAYDDATGKPLKAGDTLKGNPSIGIGRNLSGRGLTPDEQEYLFRTDFNECLADLMTFPWFHGISAGRAQALLEIRFALGPQRFRAFRDMLAAAARGDWRAVVVELRDSWAARHTWAPARVDRWAQLLEQE